MKKRKLELIISFIIVILFIGLIIYTLVAYKPKNKINVLNNKGQSQLINNSMKQNTNTNTGSSVTATVKVGIKNERVAKDGDSLTVNYTGKLENGTVFDSNVDPKFGHEEPFNFQLGAGSVIKGWDTGFVGMKVGQKKTLIIPPADAYGSRAVGPIPPNSTLIFDVQLLKIQ